MKLFNLQVEEKRFSVPEQIGSEKGPGKCQEAAMGTEGRERRERGNGQERGGRKRRKERDERAGDREGSSEEAGGIRGDGGEREEGKKVFERKVEAKRVEMQAAQDAAQAEGAAMSDLEPVTFQQALEALVAELSTLCRA